MLQAEHSAILSTFIKLPFVIKIFVLSIFEWLLKTGFTEIFHHIPKKTNLDMNNNVEQEGFSSYKIMIHFCPEDLFYSLQTVQILMKCHSMRHYIWVFTVCQSTCL